MSNDSPELSRETSQNVTEDVERAQSRPVYRPTVDIWETDDAVHVVADLPGADESSTDVTLEKNLLTIRGTVASTNVEGFRPVYSEFAEGDFERKFTISDEIDREGIEASVKHGVLRMKLPKSKNALTRKIAITAG